MQTAIIRAMNSQDLPQLIAVWNQCVQGNEVLYYPLTEDYFRQKFMLNEGCEPENLLVAEKDGQVCGFIQGVAPGTFALSAPGVAYLTCLMVAPAHRGRGVGRALLEALKNKMRARGANRLAMSNLNPIHLDWRIPGTPGHDHNNTPGLDSECAGFGFFPRAGFAEKHREVSMYQDLSHYRMPDKIEKIRADLAAEGIAVGPLAGPWDYEFDGMCDRVQSDYWRDVLRTEIAAWKDGAPNADPRFWADDVRPAGPRTILAAVHGRSIVGFTGPVDLQKSGRGWFTGICTDPLYERRGIATALFHLLMQAFVDEGARFSTLFTGTDNHAQKIYLQAGFRPVRQFCTMSMDL